LEKGYPRNRKGSVRERLSKSRKKKCGGKSLKLEVARRIWPENIKKVTGEMTKFQNNGSKKKVREENKGSSRPEKTRRGGSDTDVTQGGIRQKTKWKSGSV